MDQSSLVDVMKMDGEKLVRRLAADGFDVTAGFWLKSAEDGQWFLYIASPGVDEQGTAPAYRRVYPLITQMPQPFWVEPLEVKLIGAKDPLTRAVLQVHERYPSKMPINFPGSQLDGVAIQGAYLYPGSTYASAK